MTQTIREKLALTDREIAENASRLEHERAVHNYDILRRYSGNAVANEYARDYTRRTGRKLK